MGVLQASAAVCFEWAGYFVLRDVLLLMCYRSFTMTGPHPKVGCQRICQLFLLLCCPIVQRWLGVWARFQ